MQLDDVAWRVLAILQEEGRISFAELGRRVGLSAPAAAERVRRLEEEGIIAGYAARVDLSRVGGVVTAFLRVQAGPAQLSALCAEARGMSGVVECHAVTGQETYVLKVVAPDIAALDGMLARLSTYGSTVTSLVLSTHVGPRAPGLEPFGAPPAPRPSNPGRG